MFHTKGVEKIEKYIFYGQ